MADERIRVLLRDMEPAIAELRDRWGVSFGPTCPGGCRAEDLVVWEGFYPLRSACGHPRSWPEAPTFTIRVNGLDSGRCWTCAGAKTHVAACERDAAAIWGELVGRARTAMAEDGHPDPWA